MLTSFWGGLLIGWIVGSIITVVVLMLFAAAKRDDFLYNDVINDWDERELKSRR